MLNIEKKVEGSRIDIALEGRLDTTTAPELEEVVKAELAGKDSLVFDLAGPKSWPLREALTALYTSPQATIQSATTE